MKSVKVFYMGEPMYRVYPHASRWQVIKYKSAMAVRWFIIRFAIAAGVVAVLLGVYFYGQFEASREVSVVNQIVTPQETAPILKKICLAESGCSQFAKNGVVMLHANVTGAYAGSVDIGKYGINNRAWGEQAAKLGYDLFTEEGNEAMAKWILLHYGSEPWYSSKIAWVK